MAKDALSGRVTPAGAAKTTLGSSGLDSEARGLRGGEGAGGGGSSIHSESVEKKISVPECEKLAASPALPPLISCFFLAAVCPGKRKKRKTRVNFSPALRPSLCGLKFCSVKPRSQSASQPAEAREQNSEQPPATIPQWGCRHFGPSLEVQQVGYREEVLLTRKRFADAAAKCCLFFWGGWESGCF